MRAAFGGYLGKEMQGKAEQWAKETPRIKSLPLHVKHKLKHIKRKLKVRGSHKPGELLKAYKLKTDNKMRNYGDIDYKKKIIRVNKKLSKKDPSHKRPVKKYASKYPEVADSIYHELDHAQYPKKNEKQVYKDTSKAMKRMSSKQKAKLYKKFN